MFSNALTIASWTAYSHVSLSHSFLFIADCFSSSLTRDGLQNPKYFLGKGFASPLLSVVGQRLVLNLRSLKTRTYSTRDLSREIDRQLEAFAEADPPYGDDMGGPEAERD
ncbi:hypothetical protein DFH29DRAFT_894214 [Suillus ampliporus]|nr:hypothetical protein DFH29DRAFT_894214 [Suillus ampliporus]